MSSYHGADTARIMDDMRRQTKRKQSKGTGINRDQREQINYKDASRNMPRHFTATIDVGLFNDIMFWASSENMLVTNGTMRRWFMADMKFNDNDKSKDLVVVLDGENASIIGMVGSKIKVTKTGFQLADGSVPPFQIWSITFRLVKSDMVGFQAKWDHIRNQMMLY